MSRHLARVARALPLLALAIAGAYELWRIHPSSGPTAGPDADIVAACGWIAWAAAGYLCLAVLAAVLGALTSAAAIARLAPPTVRTLVQVIVSTGLLAALTGTSLASAAVPAHPHAAAPGNPINLDWPGLPPPTVAPSRSAPQSPAEVVVQPGDTLWTIAARHLVPHADPAAVAAAWPQWWRANHSVIGNNPNLIHPGQHLAVPPREGARNDPVGS
jgi:nucleoid-associated protein YgaU